MRDDDTTAATHEPSTHEPSTHEPRRGRPPAWPSPPPQTIEHAVALLAASWTRGRGAA